MADRFPSIALLGGLVSQFNDWSAEALSGESGPAGSLQRLASIATEVEVDSLAEYQLSISKIAGRIPGDFGLSGRDP